jgi:hypothetical protein
LLLAAVLLLLLLLLPFSGRELDELELELVFDMAGWLVIESGCRRSRDAAFAAALQKNPPSE